MSRPNLSRDRIVKAAIRMADEDGLGAVTLRGLATRLKVHVTSLYNHIPTKEALFDEMNRELMAETDLPIDVATWQEWIRRYAIGIQSMAHRHPGAFQLFQQGPARGEHAMQSIESAIAAFEADGFDDVSTHCSIRTVNLAVLGLVLDDQRRHLKPAVRAELSQLPRERYPRIHRILAVDDSADSFRFLIDALIDGIAANRNNGRLLDGAASG